MWFSKLFQARPVFTPLERQLLRELQARISPAAGDLLARQIETINRVDRPFKSKEILCYVKKGAKVSRNPALNFPIDAKELRLATIKFKHPEHPKEWNAEFWVVNGQFFSINFRPAAYPIQQTDQIEIRSVEIHYDPMQPASRVETPTAASDLAAFTGWLREWSQRYTLTDAREPLPDEQRELLIGRIGARLPDDYLALTQQCEGLVVNNCAILGLSQVYHVALADTEYYLLAERGGDAAFLAVRAETDNGVVWYLEHDGDDPVQVGISFREAVERYCLASSSGP